MKPNRAIIDKHVDPLAALARLLKALPAACRSASGDVAPYRERVLTETIDDLLADPMRRGVVAFLGKRAVEAIEECLE